ncbi:MAG: peptidase [Lacunisphaera sp.]|nr:peptidase [Lacunisphaera sp.]
MSSDTFTSLLSNTWSIFLIILFFGGSIFVHELGHFLAARRRGLKVTRFSIGMGPAIFKWYGRDGVEYRLSWIPIGGYVALPQLVDMAALEGGPAETSEPLPPISYTTRLIVLTAGAFFNILFAFALACILWVVGQPIVQEEQSTRVAFVRPTIELPDGKTAPGPAAVAGLQIGDMIKAVDGQSVKTFSDIGQLVALGHGRTADGKPSADIEFERNGQSRHATLLPELVGAEGFRDIGVEPATKVMVGRVLAGSPAEAAGLKPRDIISHLNGQPVEYVSFISEYLRNSGPQPVNVTYVREGKSQDIILTPAKAIDPDTKAEVYRFGLQLGGIFTTKIIRTPPFEQVWDKVVWTWRNLQSVLSPHSDVGISKLSGPIGIASRVNQFAQLDFRLVLWFVILVNVNLAIFNLLPIPVLDGGHMVFATLAKIRGRELPINVIATIQSAFMVVLLCMIVYVSVFDVRRIRRDSKAEAQAKEAAAEQQKKAAEPAKP